jgi:hypothetical protein
MEINTNISDYYPLYLDIQDVHHSKMISEDMGNILTSHGNLNIDHSDSFQSKFEREDLEDLVIQGRVNGFSPFQVLILLIKKTFEGHCFLTEDILPQQLYESGLVFETSDIERPGSLVPSYFENLDLYIEGILQACYLLRESDEELMDNAFLPAIHFILTNMLWKLPVSLMESFNLNSFNNMTDNKAGILRFYFELSSTLLSKLCNLSRIDKINEAYNSRFRVYVLKIGSKEQVIRHLVSKLALAYDPNIRNSEDLDRKYFDFLIAAQSGVNPAIKRSAAKNRGINPDERETNDSVEYRIKQLYRAISKNCKESHTTTDEYTMYSILDDFFITANQIYNKPITHQLDALINQYALMDLLCKTILYRKRVGLPIYFLDFTIGRIINLKGLPHQDYLQELAQNLENKIGISMHLNHTTFKAKYIYDPELVDTHKEYLKQELAFMDKKIIELTAEINEVISAKSDAVSPKI